MNENERLGWRDGAVLIPEMSVSGAGGEIFTVLFGVVEERVFRSVDDMIDESAIAVTFWAAPSRKLEDCDIGTEDGADNPFRITCSNSDAGQ